nr:glucose-6-phosphate dehydrogenase assembly protein OpcA [Nocardioides daphniae]
MDVARAAAHDHPARILGVVLGDGRGRAHIEAEVGTGAGHPGETALIRLRGAVVKHAESVVLPLLLPDSPVVVWWWGDVGPDDPSSDPLGRLATRRITDLGTEASPGRRLHSAATRTTPRVTRTSPGPDSRSGGPRWQRCSTSIPPRSPPSG